MTLAVPLRISRAPAAALSAVGLIWGSLAAMLPRIKAELGVNDAQLGMLLFLAALGSIGAMALAPRVEARAPKTALPIAGVAIAFALLVLGPSSDRVFICAVALTAVGMTTGLLDVLGNARIASLEAASGRSLMNLNHAVYSFSYAAAAALTGLARDLGLSTELWFAMVAAAALALVPVMRQDTPRVEMQGERSTPGPVPIVAILAGLIAMVSFFAENATEHWSALHIERTLGQGAALGALGPAMLGLTMGVGRLAGHFVTRKGAETRILPIAASIASGGLALAAAAGSPWVAYLGFALLGLGVSVIVPLAFALAGQAADEPGRAHAVARAAMISYFGFFVGPPLVGFVAEAAGLRAAFGVVSALLFTVTITLSLAIARRR
ncbi:MAG: MFS transporter [Pseudomonadota bacterium]